MQRILRRLEQLVGGAAKGAVLFAGGMHRARLRPREVNPGPVALVVRADAEGRAEIAGEDVSGYRLDRGAFDEQEVVRTGRLMEGERRVHVADIEGKRQRPLVEAVIGNERRLDAAAGCAGGRIRRAAEIVDQAVCPIPAELAGDAEPGAPRVDGAGEG